MNKIDLIQALKDSNDLSKSEAETVVNLFFNKMADALAEGERVEIRGLCSFFIKKYKAYTGRNPKTGEKVKVAPKKLPSMIFDAEAAYLMNSLCIVVSVRSGIVQKKKDTPDVINAMIFLVITLKIFP
jgi:integration host factor subunit beta